MPRKLIITLWIVIGLTIALFALIGHSFPFTVFFGLIFACGVLIVSWTQKTIRQRRLRRYLFLAGASAMGVLLFQGLHIFLWEGFMVMAIFVCPIALIVGAVLALRFKASSTW
jgi:hypothetical protein